MILRIANNNEKQNFMNVSIYNNRITLRITQRNISFLFVSFSYLFKVVIF